MKEHSNFKKVFTTAIVVLGVVAAVTAAIGKNIFVDFYTWIASPFQQTTAALTETDGNKKTHEELLKENSELKTENNKLNSNIKK